LRASSYLPTLLEYFWLRPETAVWRAIDFGVLDAIDFKGPILDIGCGDGAFSFMRAGGRYDPAYDFVSEVGDLDKFYGGADIYDHSPATAKPIVAQPARYKIDVGLDHKRALLDKASMTGLYEVVVEADANVTLPVPNEYFQTIYSNILYWLDDYPTTLKETERVLAPGGQVILQVPSEHFRDFSFYQRFFVRTGDPKWEWLRLIDRGRSENIKNTKSEAEWTVDFESAGLKVRRCTPYLSRLVIEAWDIGLRPISPMLIEMANSLGPGKRQDIKRKWVANLLPMLSPLCDHESDENGFYLFELTK
jgi:SAM-dependent methyltransferase